MLELSPPEEDFMFLTEQVPQYGMELWSENNNVIKNDDDTIIPENLIVDRYKVRRAKEAFGRKQKQKKKKEVEKGLQCIGTDGKRDKKTMLKETVTVNDVEVEKHFILEKK